MTSPSVSCQQCKKDFSVTAEDTKFYQKINVPAPTFCPDCRLQRRLAWRNERSLYRRPCGLCGRDTIMVYRPGGPITGYCSPCWWSDKWDPLEQGREYDFSRPFFVQFRELMERMPFQNLFVNYQTLVNSEYNNMNHNLKNCYWLFNSDYDEDCMYGEEVESAKDCIDVTMIDHSELIYESVNCNKCSGVYYSVDCEGCHDVWFSKNLSNCSNCFGCVNLKNQQYQIFNKQFSKEAYEAKLKEFCLDSYAAIQNLKQKVGEFQLNFPYKYMHSRSNIDVSGDYIYHSKNVHDSYIVNESENCRYCMWLIVKNNKDCYDYTQFGENTQLIYESMSSGNNVNTLIATVGAITCRSLSYSVYCWNNSSDLFGCIGLRAKKYCILNKQYTKEAYEALVPKIIQHMNDMPYSDKQGRVYRYGEFFPAELSYFAYNESSAYEYFPLAKDQATKEGYEWYEPEARNYHITIQSEDLPDSISAAGDDVTTQTISCAHQGSCTQQCTTAFRILPAELTFYQTHHIPLPRLCPNCRHFERMRQRNPLKLFARACQCGDPGALARYSNTAAHSHQDAPCPNKFETTYSPDRKEIIYCEDCYLKEVV